MLCLTQLNVQAVTMIWLCQLRCIAKILYSKSAIDKIPYAKIPIDKFPYARSALCRNSNCPNALQPFFSTSFIALTKWLAMLAFACPLGSVGIRIVTISDEMGNMVFSYKVTKQILTICRFHCLCVHIICVPL